MLCFTRRMSLALLILAVSASANAQNVYEGFDYTAGASLLGQSGGIGWSGSWQYFFNTTPSISSPGLNFSSLNVSGNAVTANGASGYSRLFSSPIGQDGTTTFLSFLLRANANRNVYGGLSFVSMDTTTSSPNLFIGGAGGNYIMENTGGGGRVQSGIQETIGATVLLVARMQFSAGSDRIELYVNPNPSLPLPLTPNAVKLDIDVPLTNGVYFNTGGGYTLDEVRIGASYSAVTSLTVPEPGAFAMFTGAIFCAGGLLTRRRRKQS